MSLFFAKSNIEVLSSMCMHREPLTRHLCYLPSQKATFKSWALCVCIGNLWHVTRVCVSATFDACSSTPLRAYPPPLTLHLLFVYPPPFYSHAWWTIAVVRFVHFRRAHLRLQLWRRRTHGHVAGLLRGFATGGCLLPRIMVHGLPL